MSSEEFQKNKEFNIEGSINRLVRNCCDSLSRRLFEGGYVGGVNSRSSADNVWGVATSEGNKTGIPDVIIYPRSECENLDLELINAKLRREIGKLNEPMTAGINHFFSQVKEKDGTLDPVYAIALFNAIRDSGVIYHELANSYDPKVLVDNFRVLYQREIIPPESIDNIGQRHPYRQFLDISLMYGLSQCGYWGSNNEFVGVIDLAGFERALGLADPSVQKIFESGTLMAEISSLMRTYAKNDNLARYKAELVYNNIWSKVKTLITDGLGKNEVVQEKNRLMEGAELLDFLGDVSEGNENGKNSDEVDKRQTLGIPPEDRDEYHTEDMNLNDESDSESTQGQFEQEKIVLFEIEPALIGYFVSGKKSYYDSDTQTWSKRKRLGNYEKDSLPINGDRHSYRFRALNTREIIALPLPSGYAFDSTSSTFFENQLFRDQNGCFYLEVLSPGELNLSFGKEGVPFITAPIAEEVKALTDSVLSASTENFLREIKKISGGIEDMVSGVIGYLYNRHCYPPGGLKNALKLQNNLRYGSGDQDYIAKLDQSKYLECYSMNTLAVHLCRRLNIPTRLVTGYSIEGSDNGVSSLAPQDGHAWFEFWNGSSWIRTDATPRKEKEDDQLGKAQEPGSEADDGGRDFRPKVENENNRDHSNQSGSRPSTGENSNSNDPIRPSSLDGLLKRPEQALREEVERFNEKIKSGFEQKDINGTYKVNDMSSELADALRNEGIAEVKRAIEQQRGNIASNKELQRQRLLEVYGDLQLSEEAVFLYDKYMSEMSDFIDVLYGFFVKTFKLNKKKYRYDLSEGDEVQSDLAHKILGISNDGNLLWRDADIMKKKEKSEFPPMAWSLIIDNSGSCEGLIMDAQIKLAVALIEVAQRLRISLEILTFGTVGEGLKEKEGAFPITFLKTFEDINEGPFSGAKLQNIVLLKANMGTHDVEALESACLSMRDFLNTRDKKKHGFVWFLTDGKSTGNNDYNIRGMLQNFNSELMITGIGMADGATTINESWGRHGVGIPYIKDLHNVFLNYLMDQVAMLNKR